MTFKKGSKVQQAISELRHELATPLAIVKNVSIKLPEMKVSEQSRYLDMIEKNVNKAFEILDNTYQDKALEHDDILTADTIILKTLDNFKYILREDGIIFDIIKSGNLSEASIRVNETSFFQALFNLIKNSFYSLKKSDQDIKYIKLKFYVKDQNLSISIEDNGIGLSKDERKKVFKEQFTSKKEDGHGIGLTLVHRYITQNEGEVTFDQTFYDGARFIISMPLYQEIPPKNILIVDDIEDILDTLKMTLEENNNIFICTNVMSAIEILLTKEIDIIISDFMMPDVNGLEFYTDVRESNREIPFIIFSAYPCTATQAIAKDDKNFKYVHKPDLRELEKVISSSSLRKAS